MPPKFNRIPQPRRLVPDAAAQEVQARLVRAMALHQQGKLKEAQAHYEAILKTDPRHADAVHLLGVVAAQSGDHQRAVELMNKAIARHSGNPAFHSNLGHSLMKLGQFEVALASYGRALDINPDLAEAWQWHGAAQLELKYFAAAASSFERVLAIKPDQAEAWFCLGNAHLGLRQSDKALASYDRAISIKPDHALAYSNRGAVLKDLKRLDEALSSFDQAISIRPDYAEAHSNRGTVLKELKRFEAAIASYDRAIVIRPDHAEAHSNRGSALKALRRLDEAQASFDRAITIRSDYAEAHYNRGTTLRELGQLEAALLSLERAISLKPDFAKAHCNLGTTQQDLGRLDAALASYERALGIEPDYANAHWNKGLTRLLQGDLAEGWRLYEWRWQRDDNDSPQRDFEQARWLGTQSLQGKAILLHSEQGLGDTIQFCRYAGMVAKRGARVIAEVPNALLGLMQSLDGVDEWVARGERLPTFDFHCPLLSLPRAFGTTLDTIPAPGAYLRSDPGKRMEWAARLGPSTRPRVGLVWSGSTIHKNDQNRSIRLSSLIEHLPDGIDYVSLQQELREADQATLAGCARLRHYGAQLKDFSDTAALCDLMDLVISVDTSVAHLGGALGRPTWVLLPHVPDWRWLLGRDDSPWYPSARLYRQEADRDWIGVFRRLHVDLSGLAA